VGGGTRLLRLGNDLELAVYLFAGRLGDRGVAARLCLYERAAPEAVDARVGIHLDGVARLGLRIAVALARRPRARKGELGLALGELNGVGGGTRLLRLGNDLELAVYLFAGRLGDRGVAARLRLCDPAQCERQRHESP